MRPYSARAVQTILLGVVILLALVHAPAPPPARAGEPIAVLSTNTFARWMSFPITFRTDTVTMGEKLTQNEFDNNVVSAAFAPWVNVPTANVTVALGANLGLNVTTGAQFDALTCTDNPIVYDDTGTIIDDVFGPGAKDFVLGFAGPCSFDSMTGEILGGNSVLNGFTITGPNDLLGTAVHEFGHFLGLGHSQVNRNCLEDFITGGMGTCGNNSDDIFGVPTMFPISFAVFEDSMNPQDFAITLAADDAAWLSFLYQETVNNPPTQVPFNSVYGVLSGNVFATDGLSSIQGANITGRQVDDAMTGINESRRCAISTVSGYRYTGNLGLGALTNQMGNPANPGAQAFMASSPGTIDGSLYGFFEVPLPGSGATVTGLPPGCSGATLGQFTGELESIRSNFTGGSSVGPLGNSFPSGAGEQIPVPGGSFAPGGNVVITPGGVFPNNDFDLPATPPTFDQFETAANRNDTTANATIVGEGVFRGSISPTSTANPAVSDVDVFRFVAPPMTTVVLSTTARAGIFSELGGGPSFLDSVIEVIDNATGLRASICSTSMAGPFNQPCFNDDISGMLIDSRLFLQSAAGGTFFVRVMDFRGDARADLLFDLSVTGAQAASADLLVTQTDSPDPVDPNMPVTYTITVTNNGPAAATAVTVTDVLSGVTFVTNSAIPSQGNCVMGGNITCNLGNMANGASATVTVTVTPTAGGTLTNTVAAVDTVASTTDPNTADNTSIAENTTVNPLPPSCTINFDNTTGNGLWQDAMNWDTDTLPVPTDDVCVGINPAGPFTVTKSAAGGDSINSLLIVDGQGVFTLGSDLAIMADSSIGSGGFAQTAGTLSGTGAGAVTITGTFDWSGGTQQSPGSTVANGTLNFLGDVALSGRNLFIGGTANFAGTNTISMSNGGRIENQVGATFNATGDGSIVDTGIASPNFIENFGTFSRTGSGGTFTVAAKFDNSGSVDVASGTLSLGGPTTSNHTGTFTANGGATLALTNTHVFVGATLAGAGTIDLQGTATVSGTTTFNVTGSTVVTGMVDFNNGAILTSLGTFTVNGTASFFGGLDLNLSSGILNGTGTVAGNVNHTGGSINPGTSIGALLITGDLVQTAGGTMTFEIGGVAGAGLDPNGHDQLNVFGNATVDGTWNVVLTNSFTPSLNDQFTIAQCNGGPTCGSGNPTLVLPALPAGLAWDENVNSTNTSQVLTVVLATKDFDGGGDGISWTDPVNWSGDTLPIATDNVTIGAAFNVIKSGSGGDTVNDLTVDGSLDNQTGSTLTIDGTLTVNSPLTVSGGTVTVNGNADISQLVITGGTLEISSPAFNFNANEVNMSGGNLNINTTLFVQGIGGTTFNQSGGITTLTAGPAMLIGPSVELTGGVLQGIGTVAATVNNTAGMVSPGMSIGILSIQGFYNQSGTGMLNIELGGTGGTPGVDFDQLKMDLGAGTTATLGGILNLNQSGVFVPMAGNSFPVVTFDAVAGDFATKNDNTGSGLTLNTTINANDYTVSFAAASACTINFDNTNNNGLWQDAMNWDTDALPTATDEVCIGVGAGPLAGPFTVTKSGPGGDSINGCTVADGQGVFTLDDNLDIAGTCTIGNGGFAHSSGTLNGPGSFDVNGPTMWTGGTQDGGGAVNFNGLLTLNGGTRTVRNRILNLNGGGNWSAGNIQHGQGAVINLPQGQTFDIQDDVTFVSNQGGTPSAWNNMGNFTKSGGVGTTTVQLTFTHSMGSVNANSGTLSLTGSGLMSSAPMTVSLGATLRLGAGDLNAGTDITGAGLLFLSGNNVNFNAGSSVTTPVENLGTVVFNTGADVNLPSLKTDPFSTTTGTDNITVAGPATLNGRRFSGSGVTNFDGPVILDPADFMVFERDTNFNAPVIWSGAGNLEVDTPDTVTIGPAGVFDIQTDADIGCSLPPCGKIMNNGTFKKTAGNGVTQIATDFETQGTVDIQTGSLDFANPFTQNGGSTRVGPSANVVFGQAFLRALGEFRIANNALVTGNLNNEAGTVRIGDSPGSAAIVGNYTQSAAGTLVVELAGTGGVAGTDFDFLNITGTATLDGTLTVDSFMGFVPSAGNSFQILTATTGVNGDFATKNDNTGSGLVFTGTPGANDYNVSFAAASACTKDFDMGGATSDWNTATNWNPDGVPGMTDDVCIGAFTVNYPVAAGSTTINSLTLGGTLSVDGGTLTVTNGPTISMGTLRLNGGSFSTPGTLTQTGGLIEGGGPGTLTAATLNQTGGIIGPGLSPGILNITGNITQGVAGVINIELGGLNPGNTATDHDQINISGNAAVDGTFRILQFGGFAPNIGDSFTIATCGGGPMCGSGNSTTDFSMFPLPADRMFIEAGTNTSLVIQVVAVTKDFDGGGDGTSWTDPLNWTGDTLPGPADNAQIGVNPMFPGPFTVTKSGAGGDSVNSLTVADGQGVFTLSSNLTIASASAIGTGGFTQTSGTLQGAGTLTITGAFNWSGGTQSGAGATTVNSPLNITGTVTLDTRTLNNNGTANMTGGALTAFQFANGAIFNNTVTGTFNANSDIGTIDLGGGGTFNNAGAFIRAVSAQTFLVGTPFNNTGTVNVMTGGLEVGNGTSSGPFTVAMGSTLTISGVTYTLTSDISGAGTVNLASATLNYNGGNYNVTGTTRFGGNGTTNINSGVNLISVGVVQIDGQTANFSSGEPVNAVSLSLLNDGVLTGSDTVTVAGATTWGDGTMSGAGITNTNGSLSIAGNAVLDTRTLNNNGAGTMSGAGNLSVNNNAMFNNGAAGTFDAQGNVNFSAIGGGTMTNAGMFTKSGGGNTAVSPAFTNTGTLISSSGSLNFATFTQTAGITRLAGGTFNFVLGMALNGGRLEGGGAGTVGGDVNNTGGTVSPGLSADGLTIIGNYTQGAGGALDIELGGTTPITQFDVLSITGTATLDGTLNVSSLMGFTPMTGDMFQVMSYASVTGDFATKNGLNISTPALTAMPQATFYLLSVAVPTADLVITKTDAPDPVDVGQNLTYTVTVTNNGPDPATNVVVTDTLPAGVNFVSTTGCAEDPNGVATCTLGTIANGAMASYTITVVPQLAAAGTTITNTASVTATEMDPNAANNTVMENTVVRGVADLAITKTDSADPVDVGQNYTYTVTVTNNGPNDANNVVVTDNLPAGLTLVSTTGCAEDPAGTPTCTLGTIANGAMASYTITVTPTAAVAGTTVSNTATVTSTDTDPNPGDNSATETTAVNPAADLSITKTDSPDPVDVGQNLTYTVTVTNNGPNTANNVVVTDTLPAGVNFVSTTGCAEDPNGVPTCTLGTIANGAMASYTITVVPQLAAAGTIITNTASVAATEMDPNAANNTVMENTVVRGVADLAITKTDSADPVDVGQNYTYTVTVTNNGPNDANNVVVTDNLPAGLTLVSTTGCAEDPAGAPTCTLGTIANGAMASYSITVTPTAAVAGTTVSNTATVTSTDTDPNPGDNSATETTAVNPAADLSITKTDSPDPITLGAGDVTYTVTVTNNGPSAATGVVVTDTLPAGVNFVSSSGCAEDPTGVPTCTLGNIASGAMASYTITVTPTATGVQTNAASVAGNEFDPNGANNSVMEDTTVNPPVADVGVTKTDAADPVTSGQNISYTITVTNNGPDPATNATLMDAVPAGTTFVSLTAAAGWTCTTPAVGATGNISCSIANLATSTNEVFTLVVATSGASVPSVSNTATVSANETDNNAANDSATETTTVIPLADLGVTKTDAADPVNVGQNIVYTVTVTNAGPDAAPNVVLTDTLPVAVTFVSAVPSQGACMAPAGVTLTCNLGTINSGAMATVTVTVTADPLAAPSVTNTAAVSSGAMDPNAANDMVSEMTTVNPLADLAITKTGTPDPVVINNSLTYTVTVTNNGPSPATGVVITDTLPGTVAFVSATGTAGLNCTQAAGVVTCNLAGMLNSGATTTATIVVTAPGTAGSLTNSASVMSAIPDPNAANDSVMITTNVTQVLPATDFSLMVQPINNNVVVGQNGTYQVLVGPLPAGTSFANPINLACMSPTGSCTITPGQVTPGTNQVTAMMTVQTNALLGSAPPAVPEPAVPPAAPPIVALWTFFAGLLLISLGYVGRKTQQRRLAQCMAFGLALLVVSLGVSQSACVTQARRQVQGPYTVTVTATSGSLSHSATTTLNVTQP